MRNKWNNSVFLRLLSMFLVTVTLIFVIGIGIYNWGVGAVKSEINSSVIAQTSFYLNRLDTEIQRIKLLQYECISDEDLNALAFASESMNYYEKSQAMLRLQRRLIVIKRSSPYIDDVNVSIASLDLTVSANQGIVQSISESDVQPVDGDFMAPESQLVLWQGRLYLNAAYPLSVRQSATGSSYIIQIKLRTEAFEDDLAQFNTYDDSASFMASRDGTFFLVNRDRKDEMVGARESLIGKLNDSETGVYDEAAGDRKYMVVYSTSDYLGLSVARYIPESAMFSKVNRYRFWLWTFVLAALVIVPLFSLSIYNFIHKPLRRLVKAFKNVERGDLKVYIEHRHNDEFKYLYQRFNAMVENLDTLIDQVYKQKILMQNAQLKQLQAQINPHFLYNTFFVLYSIVQAEDYESTLRFLQQLGSFFKFITRNAEEEVPLYKEIEHARTYTNIQALRFSRRIAIEFAELPPRFAALPVPRLIVQPIIENSFKYGLEDKAENGLLSIGFLEEGDSLGIVVEDNGNGMSTEGITALQHALANKEYAEEMTGIVNIHKRLQLKFGEDSGISVSPSETGGLKVIIRLKLNGGV